MGPCEMRVDSDDEADEHPCVETEPASGSVDGSCLG